MIRFNIILLLIPPNGFILQVFSPKFYIHFSSPTCVPRPTPILSPILAPYYYSLRSKRHEACHLTVFYSLL